MTFCLYGSEHRFDKFAAIDLSAQQVRMINSTNFHRSFLSYLPILPVISLSKTKQDDIYDLACQLLLP
jgi:hypothetical protein